MAELFIVTLSLTILAPCLWAADNLSIFADQDDDLDATPRRAHAGTAPRCRPPRRPSHSTTAHR